jgi:rhodanese-related sulfurtransferase
MINKLHNGHDHLLLCICNSGRRSVTAAEMLRSLGYPKALSVAGGFQAWKKLRAAQTAVQ